MSKYDVQVNWSGWTKGSGWNLNIGVFDEEQEADRLPRTNREAMGYTRFIMDELETWSDDELREIAAAEKEDMMFTVTFWFNDDPDANMPAKGYEFWASKLADHILRQRAEKEKGGSNQGGYNMHGEKTNA